jgi:hypothetical protein
MGKRIGDFFTLMGLAFVCLLPHTIAGAPLSPKTPAELAESACAKLAGAYTSNSENAETNKPHLAEWTQLCSHAANQTCNGTNSLIQALRGLSLLTCKR